MRGRKSPKGPSARLPGFGGGAKRRPSRSPRKCRFQISLKSGRGRKSPPVVSFYMPNIEIKARYQDLSKARLIAKRLKAKVVGTDRQRDTYFITKMGRLKLRESSLSGAQLIPYSRPNQRGPKKSDYLLIPIDNPAHCKQLFRELLGVEVVVDKVREIFLIGNVRVHLDQVKGLGIFFEFEAVYQNPKKEASEYKKVKRLMKQFGIVSTALLTGSYRELMLEAGT